MRGFLFKIQKRVFQIWILLEKVCTWAKYSLMSNSEDKWMFLFSFFFPLGMLTQTELPNILRFFSPHSSELQKPQRSTDVAVTDKSCTCGLIIAKQWNARKHCTQATDSKRWWTLHTLYVSQFLKKLTEPSTLLWITVQPPGSCLWSHHTCISLLAFSGFTRYMPLAVWPSSRACKQSLNGPEQMVWRC